MDKFAATGAKNITMLQCGESGGNVVIKNQRDIPSNPPAFAKKFIKGMNTVTGTDTWHSFDDDVKKGSFTLDIKGVPVKISGNLTLQPTDEGCDYIIEFMAKINIPLIGKKLGQLFEDDTRANQDDDYKFTMKYIESL